MEEEARCPCLGRRRLEPKANDGKPWRLQIELACEADARYQHIRGRTTKRRSATNSDEEDFQSGDPLATTMTSLEREIRYNDDDDQQRGVQLQVPR